MCKNTTIQIRMTEREKKLILNKMESEGYHCVSIWIRNKLLSDSLWTEQKINAIYKKICVDNNVNRFLLYSIV